jgi:hypothetical protein
MILLGSHLAFLFTDVGHQPVQAPKHRRTQGTPLLLVHQLGVHCRARSTSTPLTPHPPASHLAQNLTHLFRHAVQYGVCCGHRSDPTLRVHLITFSRFASRADARDGPKRSCGKDTVQEMARLGDKARCEGWNVVDRCCFSIMHVACDGLIFTVSCLGMALIVNRHHALFFLDIYVRRSMVSVTDGHINNK